MAMIQLKRAYAPAEPDDGYRILVDRLWPRGMSKAKEHLDLWMKQIAPSTDLRKAWNHNPNTILEFAESYRRELDANPAVEQLEQILAPLDNDPFRESQVEKLLLVLFELAGRYNMYGCHDCVF